MVLVNNTNIQQGCIPVGCVSSCWPYLGVSLPLEGGGSAFSWHCGNADPSPCEQKNTCENITLPYTSYAGGNNTHSTRNIGDYQWTFFIAESETGEPPHGYHLVRLMTFIPGEIFVNVPYTPNLLYQAGRHVASIEKALKVRCVQHYYQSTAFTTWVFGAKLFIT